MTMCRNYLQHVLSALWRRKSGALALVMTLTVLLLFVQYHSVQHEGHEHTMLQVKNPAVGQRTLRTLDSKANGSDKEAGGGIAVAGAGSDGVEVVDRLEPQRPPPPFVDSNNFPRNINQNHRAPGVLPLPYNVGSSNNRFNANIHRAFQGQRIFSETINHNGKNEYQKLSPLGVSGVANEMFAGNANRGNVPFHPANGVGVYAGEQHSGMSTQAPYVPKHRLFHLDLKGAPPKVSYLKKLFPLLKQLGTTGILIEYEDMFPYEGDLAPTAAKNHYSKEDVKSILQMSKDNELEVIPLIQTFGHAEFILKHRDFGHLREVPNIPQSFCPSNNESMLVIEDMIDQIIAMHPGIRWLHIGCDEVFQLGICPKCMMRSMTQGRDELFLSHVAHVASYVRERYNVSPIMWDDMLHHFTAEMLKRYNLGNLVEIMIWTYVQDVYRFIPHDVWAMYGEVFPYVWSASAFKGAFGETLSIPPVKTHLENNLAWLEVMGKEHGRFREFRGIALTGWQRYDHFATLCELLPAGIPSAALNMLTLTHGYYNETWMQKLYESLQCMKSPKYSTFINLDVDPYMWDKMSWCFFPGLAFFKMTERLDGVRKSVSQFLQDETVKKAWLTEYNVRHNYSSVSRIDASLSNFPFQYPDVETLIRNARDTLREVYDEYTVAEWIEQNVYPMLRKLDLFRQTAESLKKAAVWPVRPLDPLPELHKYGIGIPTDNPRNV